MRAPLKFKTNFEELMNVWYTQKIYDAFIWFQQLNTIHRPVSSCNDRIDTESFTDVVVTHAYT